MKNLTFVALSLVFLALLSVPVQASYSASLEASLETGQFCPCDIISTNEMEVRISNYGSSPDTYYMSLELPDSWSGFILPQLTVDSGETLIIDPVWITPACGTVPGTYTVTIAAESGATGKEFRKQAELEIMRCHEVSVSSENHLETCEDGEVETTVEVTNLGKSYETFTLSVSPEWAVLSADTVELDAGESGTVSLKMSPKGVTGTQDVRVTAQSQSTYANSGKTIALDVKNCYDFSAAMKPEENSVCLGRDAQYQLLVDNLGTEDDTYKVTVPEWVTAEDYTFSLGANERKTVGITASPETKGTRDVVVSVSSLTRPTKVIDVVSTLNVSHCSLVAVTISPEEREICREDSTSFVVTVENIGTVPSSYELDASTGELSKKKVVLDPGEKENVLLNVDSVIKAGMRTVSVSAYNSGVTDSDSAVLNVENCYDASLAVSPSEKNACMEDTLTYELDIKNTGELPDEYVLEYPWGKEEFSLSSGQSVKLKTQKQVKYPWGSENVLLFVLHSSKGVHIEKNAIINVVSKEDCYSVEMGIASVNSTKKANETVEIGYGVAAEIFIKNKGLRSDTYDIVVEGPDWAHVNRDSVFLTPGQEERVYLYMSPSYGTTERDYAINVLADSGNALSGVEIVAAFADEAVNITANVTESGNFTQWYVDLTGMFVAFEEIPMEVALLSLLAFATAVILVLRFLAFR